MSKFQIIITDEDGKLSLEIIDHDNNQRTGEMEIKKDSSIISIEGMARFIMEQVKPGAKEIFNESNR